MSVLGRLATALGRNDERPNVDLAIEIAADGDAAAVRDLVAVLTTGGIAVRNDALKVLYEIGARRSDLVAPYVAEFLALLDSRNNRTVWGALKAIETVTAASPGAVFAARAAIVEAADRSSVIARDACIGILAGLAAAGHGDQVLPLLLARLAEAAPNQFPTYAEQIAAVADAPARQALAGIIRHRLPRVTGTAKVRRLQKLLRRLAEA